MASRGGRPGACMGGAGAALFALAACRGGGVGSIATLRPDPTPSAGAPAADANRAPPGPVGGAGDANAASDANANASTKPGAGACAGRALRVCDDFEATPIGAPPDANLWEVRVQNPTSRVVVEGGRALSGSRSLHLSTANSGYEVATIVNTSAFPAPDNQIFGRVFFYMESEVPQIHFNLVSGSGRLPGESQPATYNIGGQYGIFLANYYDASNPGAVLDLWQHAGVADGGQWTDATYVPRGRWTCLEWQFTGATDEIRMWLDGAPVDRMHVAGRSTDCCPTTTWTAPPFDSLSVGLQVVANQEPISSFSLFVDGVALDAARIGCDH